MDERSIIRKLAAQYAEIANSDATKEKTANWARLNALDNTARPAIIIDQLPYEELAMTGELDCVCQNPMNHAAEAYFRFEMFRHNHFGADLVLPPFFPLSKSYTDSGCGVETELQEEKDYINPRTHLYADQFQDLVSVEKLHKHIITVHPEETAEKQAFYEEMFGDILPVRPMGTMLWAAVWDRLTLWKGAESVLYALIDEPELIHALMKRMTEIEMDLIDQLEAQNLLCAGPGAKCHCIETYVDEDKWCTIDQNHILASDCWISGAAQIFSEVSPLMHDEYEIEYMKTIYNRFGWVNYGCCEPLDKKIDIIKKMKTVRAISASPWTNVDMQAEAMGNDYVMLRKPNPAFVVSGYPDEVAIRAEIRTTLQACRRNGTPVAFVLKDITSAGGGRATECITEWLKIVQDEIDR